MLYNKYRPQHIQDIVGQDGIKVFLSKITPETVPHTLIFYGPSGTGKTTAARLLAKKLFCINPTKDGDVCGVCYGCKSVDSGNSLDYLEIDATSSGGVEDVRMLKDKLALNTLSGGRRVVYIDEAHQLTKKAFDALLKVLEEESANVFVLATTEINKLPKTVRTRALELEFSSAKSSDIKKVIKTVAENEGYTIEDDVLTMITVSSESSFRRALTLLEQLLLQSPTKDITVENVEAVSALMSSEDMNIFKIFSGAFAKIDWATLMNIAQNLPDDDKKLRGISKYMYTVAMRMLENQSKKNTRPSKAHLAKMQFVSSLGSVIGNQAAIITKPAVAKAIVDYILYYYS